MKDSKEPGKASDYLSVAFEVVDQAVVVFDEDLRMVAWNGNFEKLEFFPAEHIHRGARIEELFRELARTRTFGEGDPEDIVAHRLAAARDGSLAEVELLHSRDGRMIQVRRFRLDDGGLCATFSDITEQRETQEFVRQSAKMDVLGRFTGGIAHDMNNVLASVIGNLELSQHGGPKQAGYVAAAMEAALRGAKLTHRLLAFARQQPLSPRTVAPGPLLSDALSMLRALLPEDIEASLRCDPDLWDIEVDPIQFESVIANIALNARDAMPGGGTLIVRAANLRTERAGGGLAELGYGEFVSISISDTGSGMAPEVVERAFEPFFSTKGPGNGTGLGLAMAHGFVRQSGGDILILSSPGEGTTVRIFLPRVRCGPRRAALPEAEVPTRIEGAGRILVVEDNARLRATVGEMLGASGFRATTVPDGPAAVAVLEGGAVFDLLLTDVVLPGGMNGRDVAGAALGALPDVKVIYMSGYSEDVLMNGGRLDPGITLLQKPFRRAELIREIVRAMA